MQLAVLHARSALDYSSYQSRRARCARHARRSLHRALSSPLQPPIRGMLAGTRLRQQSLPLPQPTARSRADQSRPRCSSRCSTLVRLSITPPISRCRCHSQPLALVLISHDPDAARGAPRSFGSRLLLLSVEQVLGAESNRRLDREGGSTQGTVRSPRPPQSSSSLIQPASASYPRHARRHSPTTAVVAAATANRSLSC